MVLAWDLFCRVVDNFGDIGVCWRLAADLGSRGHRVRLWTDDDRALAWMAPQGHPGVEVLPWQAAACAAQPADVVIEAFACDPPPAFIEAMAARARPPVWINLEYLSAEAWVQRCHGLPSPRLVEPGRGLRKWFFHPGFSAGTGGLLREAGLIDEREAFDREPWLQRRLGLRLRGGECLVVVFCYDAVPLHALRNALARESATPVVIALTPGPAHEALDGVGLPAGVRTLKLPWLSQEEFDRLLWSADLNLVRGEDSAVRAIWAGRPFVWQLYPQHDLAHHAKAQAFLDTFFDVAGASPALCSVVESWWQECNGMRAGAAPDRKPPPAWPDVEQWQAWSAAARRLRDRLAAQEPLSTRLLDFVAARIAAGGPGPSAAVG